MKTEFKKGLEQGLNLLEQVLRGLEQGEITFETAYEMLRDERNIPNE